MTDADTKFPLARIVLIAATVLGFAATAVAQEIPEGQSCGGLVCDLGLFGHKTAPKAAPAVPVPAAATPVPAPARTAATPETEGRRSSHKKAFVAKAPAAKVPKTAAAKAAKVSPVAALGAPPVTSSLVPAAPAAARAPAPVTTAPPPAVTVAPPATAIPVTATPNEPVVLSNPYVYNKPLKFMFQSVDPTQGVQ